MISERHRTHRKGKEYVQWDLRPDPSQRWEVGETHVTVIIDDPVFNLAVAETPSQLVDMGYGLDPALDQSISFLRCDCLQRRLKRLVQLLYISG